MDAGFLRLYTSNNSVQTYLTGDPIRFRQPDRTAQFYTANSEVPDFHLQPNCCQQLKTHDLGECGLCRVSAVACQARHRFLHKFSHLIAAEFREQTQAARPSNVTVYSVQLAKTVNIHYVWTLRDHVHLVLIPQTLQKYQSHV
jgi:hypothetical protein